MSAYLKDALQSLHSSSSYLRLPSTDGIQSRTSSLHPRNPKALLIFLILVFFLFWRNIITDVCSHLIHRIPSASIKTNPIKNNTLGVRLPCSSSYRAGLILRIVSRTLRTLASRTRRSKSPSPGCRQCYKSYIDRSRCCKGQANSTV